MRIVPKTSTGRVPRSALGAFAPTALVASVGVWCALATSSLAAVPARGHDDRPTSGPSATAALDPATSVRFGTFESRSLSREFSGACPSTADFSFLSSPVRQGRYSLRIATGDTTSCTDDPSTLRADLVGLPAGESFDMNPGSYYRWNGDELVRVRNFLHPHGATFYWAISILIPSGAPTTYGFLDLAEIHQSNDGTSCEGPAPFNLDAALETFSLIVRGTSSLADCQASRFTQHRFGGKPGDTRWRNGVSARIVRDRWYDFLLGWHVAASRGGWFEAWLNGPGTGGRSVLIVRRTPMRTSYPVANYPQLSLYYQAAGNTGSGGRAVVYDGSAISTDLAALRAWQDSFTHSWR